MRIIILFVAVLLFMIPGTGRSDRDYDFVCNISGGSTTSGFQLMKGTDLAGKRVSAILEQVGLEKNFAVHAANVDNASALVKGSERLILYNPSFMQSVRNAAGVDWTSYSILAHEIGHHLNGHTLHRGGSRPAIELEADEFSGFVLRKMGATLAEAQAAMALIADPKGSTTHPGRKFRLAAIERGWRRAGK